MQKQQSVERVLWTTLLLNLAVAVGKIVLGMVTGALAISADGFHSITDSAGNIAGLVALRVANKPADENHPYGHRRFENLAALLIGALLLLTAWEIAKGLFERLQNPQAPELSPLSFGVMLFTLAINIAVSRYQIRAGQALKSEILLADAQNTSADVFVTLSVLFSMAVVAFTGWLWVDVLAALVVVLLIGKAAWGILQQTGSILVDTAPYEPSELSAIIGDTAEVLRARSRGSRDAAHIDVDLLVAPEMTAEHGNNLATALRQKLENALEGIQEIEVHFVPDQAKAPDAILTARAYADARGLSTHEVQVCYDAWGCVLEMHVEVPAEQSLAQAHAIVSALEADISRALPQVDRVLSHIEPKQSEVVQKTETGALTLAKKLQNQANNLLEEAYPHVGWHDLIARPVAQGYTLSLHATLPAIISVEAAHQLAESAETLIRAQVPEFQRVTIHTEPFDHD